MLLRIFFALAGLLVFAPTASAQTFTIPEIGFQDSGTCRQLAVRERDTKTMVPLGCLDIASKGWYFQPRKVMTGAFGAANKGPDASIGPVLEADGTVTMFGPNTPANGTWITNDLSLKCEPILGPFHAPGTDLTRCGTARYITSTGDENHGEYGTIFQFRNNSGFPGVCQRNKFYPEFGTCINDNGKMYRVKEAVKDANGNVTQSYYGTTASSGSGPTGTSNTIVDGGVTWRYEPNFTPGNGGKTNFALMSYQEANSGALWTTAMAHQIGSGGSKKTAYTMELDLNNYWGDYSTGPSGPAATALQIFMGGPHRSTSAIAIGQYDQPEDSSSVVDAITICCNKLARDNTIVDLTGSTNGIANLGKHSGSAFTDGSTSFTSFNSYGGADIGFRHAGSSAVGLKLEGTYRFFQVQGIGWSVSDVGSIASTGHTVTGNSSVSGTSTVGGGLTVTAGALKPAQYTVSSLFPCGTSSKGSIAVVTDLARAPQYREFGIPGGGNISAPMFCNGTSWEAH